MHLLKGFLVVVSATVSVALASAISNAAVTIDGDNNVCTVKALGHQQNDVPNILEAFRRCGNGGTVIFPEDQNYWIASKLNPVINNILIQWHGIWTVSIGHPCGNISIY
jgi:galacturan 1,4-alpha-galacturonidase